LDTSDADRPGDSFPLTEIQYAYWVGREPDFMLGNVGPNAYFELEGRRLDHTVLTNTWRQLVRRHEMLRTVVLGDGRQRVLPAVPDYEIEYSDLRDIDSAERDKRLAEIREEMSGFKYSADRWPLFDIRLTRLPEHDRLHISFDRLMVDLASVALLLGEWSALCMRPQQALPPVEVTFQDHVHALDRTHGTPQHQRALEYWAGRAEALAPPPELPLACPPASVHKPVFTHRAFTLAPDAWQRFQNRAQEWGLTPSAVLAAAFGEVLRLWSGTSRFTLSLTSFNRLPLALGENAGGHRMEHPDLQRVVGEFTSICLLDMDTAAGVPFTERARRAQRQLQQDLRHRQVSALHALRERRRRGSQAGLDTMPVMFTSGLGTVADLTEPLEYFGEIGYRVNHTPQVWLDHQAVDFTGSLELSWDAVEELFPNGLLDDMFTAYRGLVERLANTSNSWTAEIVVELPDHQVEQRKLINDTASPPPTGLLHEPFLAQVPLRPRQPAVITSAGTVDYAGLAAAARAVAQQVNPGAEPVPDDLVGVVANKSVQQVVAAYGVLLAGKAYLPVNPALPTQRLHQILADGDVTVAVTTAEVDQRLEWPGDVRRVRVPDRSEPPPASGAPASPDDLAYVIYTSGSTGQPKGVMIEHRAALNTVVDINERFGVRDTDRVFGLADLSFDLSVYDLFGTHAAGATLVLPDADKVNDPAHWAELMTEHGVTVWNSVPAQMQMLVEHLEAGGKVPPDLRLVMLSGDWIPVDLPDRINDLWPEAEVISLGGATEASIWSIYHPVTFVDADAASIPYGKPLLNQGFQVLNERLEPCPTWVTGELFIDGYGLARGYWKNPEKTAASFIEHPRTGARLYRTGDFGRYLPGGEIQFLGRRDGQVKIGGYRIELGEIEAVLQRHPGVQQAVVVKADDPSGSARLAGYVTLTEPAEYDRFDPDVLRAFVGERLPKHMVPARVSALTELPRSRTGKIDRAALAQASTGLARRTAAAEPPRTDRQRKLVEIWKVVLGLDEVGITDDFLEVGGDSLLAARLAANIRTAFGIDLSVSAVLTNPSVEALDGYLDKTAVERRAETALETA
jgi:pyochelin synthetase